MIGLHGFLRHFIIVLLVFRVFLFLVKLLPVWFANLRKLKLCAFVLSSERIAVKLVFDIVYFAVVDLNIVRNKFYKCWSDITRQKSDNVSFCKSVIWHKLEHFWPSSHRFSEAIISVKRKLFCLLQRFKRMQPLID